MLSNKVHIGLAVSLLFAYISLLAGPNLIFSESMSVLLTNIDSKFYAFSQRLEHF